MGLLVEAAIFFAAAVVVVPVFKRLGLGAVLGYLAAGALIGPSGFALIEDSEAIHGIADFGVVLLLFVIGLELQPLRLWTMRSTVFGLGSAQVVITGAVVTAMAAAAGLESGTAIVVGLALALSSTAFALQILSERGTLATHQGRAAFSVLLFQDIAAIPILAIIPLLGGATAALDMPLWFAILRVVGVIIIVVLAGRYLLRPILRAIARTRLPELFTASALLIVTVTAILMNWIGISMALGAFVAGMLLADSEYRHQLEADIEPFKGLLLGLFFITVGMRLKLEIVAEQPVAMIVLVGALMGVKTMVAYGLGRRWKLSDRAALDFGATIAQGGEFAFVIFASAATAGVMTRSQEDFLVLVVSLSMVLSPFLLIACDKIFAWRDRNLQPAFDTIPEQDHPVIIAGFGRVGQIVGRVLGARKIPFTALDVSADQVDFVKRFGNKVYYGDASRADLLRAAGAEKAKIIVIAIDDVEASLRTVATVRQNFRHLKIFARARNRKHAYQLMDLGVTALQRETFLSSLRLTHDVLIELGFSHLKAERTIRTFEADDEHRLYEHYTHQDDMSKMQDLAKIATKELEEMFERDVADRAHHEDEDKSP